MLASEGAEAAAIIAGLADGASLVEGDLPPGVGCPYKSGRDGRVSADGSAPERQADAVARAAGDAGPIVGADGFATLALACAVAVATLGGSVIAALWHVARVARTTSSMPSVPVPPGRVVVLGQRLPADGAPCARFRARLDRARALAARHDGLTVVVLGGAAAPGLPSEAEAGRRYLLATGLPAARIAIESRSRHTLENLRNYRSEFQPDAAVPDLLVSSRFHLARAALMARGLGLAHVPCAAEDRFRLAPGVLARLAAEAFLFHWYVVGRGFARLVGHRGMLARIS